MKIFITGGSGFIGRNLKEQLAGFYEILAPDRTELDLLDSEKVREYLLKYRFDAVIHAATWDATRNSGKDTTHVLEYNLRMFFNLARCAGHYGRLIHFGSGAEFGREHWKPGMKEDYFETYVPKDPYGFSKYLIHQYGQEIPNILNLRLFAVFGKYEDWEIRFISNACCKAMWDLPITIKQNVFFDFLHVDDLVKIVDWFLQNPPREKSYNVCSGRSFDLAALAKMVLKAAGKNLEIKIVQSALGLEYRGDHSRLVGEMGSLSLAEIDRSIKKLYDWYGSHKGDIKRELLLNDK